MIEYTYEKQKNNDAYYIQFYHNGNHIYVTNSRYGYQMNGSKRKYSGFSSDSNIYKNPNSIMKIIESDGKCFDSYKIFILDDYFNHRTLQSKQRDITNEFIFKQKLNLI